MLKSKLFGLFDEIYHILLNTSASAQYERAEEKTGSVGTTIILNNLYENHVQNSRNYNLYEEYNSVGIFNNISDIDGDGSVQKEINILDTANENTIVKTAVIALVLLCVIFSTLIGNVLICIAVCLVKKLRRPCNYLIVSLAVSDLFVAILVMPLASVIELLGHWPLGPIFCDVWVCLDTLSCTASILNLCMISVDRYYAITKPLEYGVKRTPKRMFLYIFIVWSLAVCVSLPPFLIFGNETDNLRCIVSQNIGYQLYATLFSFYVPLVVMISVYYQIFKAAKKIVLEEKRSKSVTDINKLRSSNRKRHSADTQFHHVDGKYTLETNSPGYCRRCSLTKIKENKPTTIMESDTSDRTESNESHTPFLGHITPPKAKKLERPISGMSTHSHHSDHSFMSGFSHHFHDHVIGLERTISNDHHHQPSSTKEKIMLSISRIKSRSLTGIHARDILTTLNSSHHRKLRFHLAKEKKASRTLGIIMSAFIICWLPFFVLALIRPFVPEYAVPDTLSSTFLWLGYVNSLLNPIIYATLNREFRKPFNEILNFRCSKLNNVIREEFYNSQFGEPEHHCCGPRTIRKKYSLPQSNGIYATQLNEDMEASESFL